MDTSSPTKLLFFYFILFSLSILSLASHRDHGAYRDQHKPSPGQRILSTIVQLIKSSTNSLDKLKSSTYRIHEKLFPPTLDFRSSGQIPLGEDAGGKARLKEAAERSLETGEAALEGSAEIAATIMEEVVDKTKSKMKEKVSKGHEMKEEL